MTYTIGDVAQKFNLSIHTLRYYEKEGLLPFVQRSDSGIRKFDDNAIEGIKVIECLKKTNMQLKDIKSFMDWCTEGDDSLKQRQKMFHERKAIVEQQIAELNNVMELINYKCWYYDTAVELGSEKAVWDMPPEQIPEEIKALKH